MVKASVLITTYNLEKYIERTLYSVINQVTDFNFEILIGDDGSTDETIAIITKVQQKTSVPFRIYKMERETGKSYNPIYRASRNRVNLISHARGEYITFLDGDDFYIDRGFLQKQVNILDNPMYQLCVGCSCGLMNYYEKTNEFIISKSSVLDEGIINSRKYWGSKKWFHAECCLFRNLFRNSGFHMSKDYFDDNLIVFYFMKHGEIYHINNAMVAYRQNLTVWKNRSKLSKNLYNVMDYYEELRINPKWHWYSFWRHNDQFWFLWTEKDKLKRLLYSEEKEISENRKCVFVNQLFHYDELSIISKMRCALFAWGCKCIRKIKILSVTY